MVHTRRSPLMVRVLVFELNNETAIRDVVVNLPRSVHWFNKLCVWATQSHYSVEIINIEDDKDG